MKTKVIDISKIKPAEYNPRKDLQPKDKEYKKLKNSIDKWGLVENLVVNKDNTLISGHQRLKILKETGQKVVNCCIVDLNKSDEKALNIALNKTGGDWDIPMLTDALNDLKLDSFDLELTGFDMKEIDEMLGVDSKDVIEDTVEVGAYERAKSKTKIKTGDIYQLGNHKLMCADCTNERNITRLMNEEKAQLVFTDPPYGLKKENERVINDNLNFKDLLDFNKKWIPLSFKYLIDVGSWYCFGIDEPLMDIYSEILKPMKLRNEITFRNLMTWNKGNGQGQKSEEFRMYPIADEKLLFVMKGVQGFNTNADSYYEAWEPIRKYLKENLNLMGWSIEESKRIAGHSLKSGCHWFDKSQWSLPTKEVYNAWKSEANNSAFKKEYSEIKKEYYSTRSYFNNLHDNQNNVWSFKREADRSNDHATPKPIEVCARAIKSSSEESKIVLDLFGGSGSTLIACEHLNRRCFMMEIDPVYCQIIIDRFEKFTSTKAKQVKQP